MSFIPQLNGPPRRNNRAVTEPVWNDQSMSMLMDSSLPHNPPNLNSSPLRPSRLAHPTGPSDDSMAFNQMTDNELAEMAFKEQEAKENRRKERKEFSKMAKLERMGKGMSAGNVEGKENEDQGYRQAGKEKGKGAAVEVVEEQQKVELPTNISSEQSSPFKRLRRRRAEIHVISSDVASDPVKDALESTGEANQNQTSEATSILSGLPKSTSAVQSNQSEEPSSIPSKSSSQQASCLPRKSLFVSSTLNASSKEAFLKENGSTDKGTNQGRESRAVISSTARSGIPTSKTSPTKPRRALSGSRPAKAPIKVNSISFPSNSKKTRSPQDSEPNNPFSEATQIEAHSPPETASSSAVEALEQEPPIAKPLVKEIPVEEKEVQVGEQAEILPPPAAEPIFKPSTSSKAIPSQDLSSNPLLTSVTSKEEVGISAPSKPSSKPSLTSSSTVSNRRIVSATEANSSVEVPAGFRKTSTGALVPDPNALVKPFSFSASLPSSSKPATSTSPKNKDSEKRKRGYQAGQVPAWMKERKKALEIERELKLKTQLEMIKKGQDSKGKKNLSSSLNKSATQKPTQTKVQPFRLAGEIRSMERKQFEKSRDENLRALEEAREEARKEREKEEEEEMKRERARTIPKANVIPASSRRVAGKAGEDGKKK